MNIRSFTIGAALPQDAAGRDSLIARLGEFARSGRAGLEASGFSVQTTRLSAQPLELWLAPGEDAAETAAALGKRCTAEGIDYFSLGTIQAQTRHPELEPLMSALPDMLIAAENVFGSIQVGDRSSAGVNLSAIRVSAAAIARLASETPEGFGNLRFAAAANCPPHVPFYPASYYEEDELNRGEPEFGIALEAADVAVRAVEGSHSHDEARANLLAMLVDEGEKVAHICSAQGADHGYAFRGLDISVAPYPAPDRSMARALELLSGAPVGAPGTLAAAAFFTGALKEARANLPTTGYSGLMLPALEDQTLADRAAEGLVDLDTLLLLSAVCGLGLDTVPLPGDTTEEEMGRIILDMASLAIRLDKPLTARLLPVAGKKAGEQAEWPNFPYFARGRVMPVKGAGTHAQGLFKGDWLQV